MNPQDIFFSLYRAGTEADVDKFINQHSDIFAQNNWKKWGDIDSNFGVVENQQATPIAALVEKITNSIDAILMKRCYEEGIKPTSSNAPQSIENAINQFFPNSGNWDLPANQSKQAEEIQILAHGPKRDTSLVIYDNGEGQDPRDFEKTLLSLLRGNKNDIPFVQGKYNMGGSGAVVFCGKKRYQLIASKKYDNSGNFGFTLIRKHPLSETEKVKNTWYEYLTMDGTVYSFPIDELALGLKNRKFRTGTIIKLYSYQLPPGSAQISRDLNRNINEYLFEPALPVYTIENTERYPKNQNPETYLYGLKRRLEASLTNNKYIYRRFSEQAEDPEIGKLKITTYVFKFKIEGKNGKESKETVKREFFKNGMSVLFSLNGQVHGDFTYEFISRALKMQILKHHLLIHVDCTKLKPDFRAELFMGSRDRLKKGEEIQKLRKKVAGILRNSELKDIYKQFKKAMTSSSEDASNLLKDLSKNLPLNSEMMDLLQQTFRLDDKSGNKTGNSSQSSKTKPKKHKKPFDPKRFPTSFKINTKQKMDDGLPVIQLPKGEEKVVRFNTDVENDYFDRIDEPGDLHIALLEHKPNNIQGGTGGLPSHISKLLSVRKSSPNEGTIRVHIGPQQEVEIGDELKIKAVLDSPGGNLEEIFLVKIIDKPELDIQDQRPPPDTGQLGLPALQYVRESNSEISEDLANQGKTWEECAENGIGFDGNIVMYPFVEGDKLEYIMINMDSYVLKQFCSKLKSQEEIEVAQKRYSTTVYFHTLFLYMISKHRKYKITKEETGSVDVDIQDYLQDIFSNNYSAFLLNFEMADFIEAIAD